MPEIGELWSHTADLFITAITAVLERAGVQSREPRETLRKASSTCEHIWLISAGLTA